jgi:hypothetical protein
MHLQIQNSPHSANLSTKPLQKVVRRFLLSGISSLLSLGCLWFSYILIERVEAQSVIRLTFNQAADLSPAWDPRGGTIAYLRPKTTGGSVFDAYRVLSSGQGGEIPILTGLNTDFGTAVALSWIGSTGFLGVEEAISGFEVLKFDTSQAPFDRTTANGSDAANQLLLSINGGGGGGLTKFSRDGLSALVRISTQGSVGSISVRAGTVSSMVGQVSTTFGTPLFVNSSSFDATFTQGGALTPDGSVAIVAVPLSSSNGPHDLIARSVSNPQSSTNLTNNAASGATNIQPDVSPDGRTIVFARSNTGNSGPFDLFTIGIDGSNLTQITNTPNFSETSPSWAPDGTSLAFVGTHTRGFESDSPALLPGESANANIYLLSLAPANTVTPGTKLLEPPAVVVTNRTVQLTLTPFKTAQKKAASALRTLATKAGLTLGLSQRASAKFTFKYEVKVNGTGSTRKTKLSKFSTRNLVTFKNLPPGNFTSKYRVQIFQKKGRKTTLVGRTKFSPTATFTVS